MVIFKNIFGRLKCTISWMTLRSMVGKFCYEDWQHLSTESWRDFESGGQVGGWWWQGRMGGKGRVAGNGPVTMSGVRGVGESWHSSTFLLNKWTLIWSFQICEWSIQFIKVQFHLGLICIWQSFHIGNSILVLRSGFPHNWTIERNNHDSNNGISCFFSTWQTKTRCWWLLLSMS